MGGCTLDMIEADCNPDGTLGIKVLDGVTALAAQSLLRSEGVPFVSPSLVAVPGDALGFNRGALVGDPGRRESSEPVGLALLTSAEGR